MWIVVKLDNTDIRELVNLVESVYYEYNEDIILSVISNLSVKETFLMLYDVIRILVSSGIRIRRGPILYENVLIGSKGYRVLDEWSYKSLYNIFNKRNVDVLRGEDCEYHRSLFK